MGPVLPGLTALWMLRDLSQGFCHRETLQTCHLEVYFVKFSSVLNSSTSAFWGVLLNCLGFSLHQEKLAWPRIKHKSFFDVFLTPLVCNRLNHIGHFPGIKYHEEGLSC